MFRPADLFVTHIFLYAVKPVYCHKFHRFRTVKNLNTDRSENMGQKLFHMPSIKFTSQIIALQVAGSLEKDNEYPIQIRGVTRNVVSNDAICDPDEYITKGFLAR